jgi:uncharacterized damage-inducible protein DinB
MVKDPVPLPGYPEPYGLLCAILQDATVDWRGELWGAKIGPEVMTWRPRPGGQSIGAVILHMIVAEVFWFERFVLEREIDAEDKRLLMWDEIDVDKGSWPEPPYQPLSWYFELHDRFRARTLDAVKQWPAPGSLKDRAGENHKYSMLWVLGHVIQHEAYHGGQVVMLYDLWKNRDVTG